MSVRLYPCIFALALLLSGCTRGPGSEDWQVGSFIYCLHGQVDFVAPPAFEISLGSYRSTMCFDRLTVLRMGGTYLSIELPYYALLVGGVALVLVPMVVSKFNKRGAREKAG
jgi:hypothetical protein